MVSEALNIDCFNQYCMTHLPISHLIFYFSFYELALFQLFHLKKC